MIHNRPGILIPLLLATCSTWSFAAKSHRSVTFLKTLAPPEPGIQGLETDFVSVTVDGSRIIRPMPPIQGDLSQGAETGDPLFFEEMEPLAAELKPQLVRVAPFAAAGSSLSLDTEGRLQIDFTAADRIIGSLRRTGARICWNCASWPKEWSSGHDRYPKDLELWGSFIRRVVEHYNGNGKRGIDYIEFWNEPSGFNSRAYEILARTATKADPGIKVGAPATMDLKTSAIDEAVRYCHETQTPIHFISYHLYYKPPWEWPEIIAKAQAILDQYPGMEKLEMLVTEWGIDAGESGSCDTRFNAAYYCAVQERLLSYWPRVRPTHFELREGWDWKGPSRDLFGRWGMLTYSNLLPKPVFQAARMWAKMAADQIQCESSDERIRAIAAVEPAKLTILLWSYPRQYQKMQANDPEHGPSVLDIPVQIDVANIPFKSPGLCYQRFVLDDLHSNITTDLGRSELEQVHEVTLAREDAEGGFRLQTVMPLHGVSLLVLRPAERAPADVEAIPDRYQIWAGQSAEVTIQPKSDTDFPIELLPARNGPDLWQTTMISTDPLRIRIRPLLPEVRAQQYYTAWIKRTDWGALGRAVLEFRTDMPLVIERDIWRVDLSHRTRSGMVKIPVRNLAPMKIETRARWSADPPLMVSSDSGSMTIPASQNASVSARVSLPAGTAPGRYTASTTLNTGVDLDPVETEVHLPMPSYRAASAPVLDGMLDEWQEKPSLIFNDKKNWGGHFASRWDGPDDLSGRAWSRWDDQYLYFAVEVIDDHHLAPPPTRDMQKFDLVHIGFDCRRDAFDRNMFFIEDDCHYGIGLNDTGVAYRFWGAKRREEVAQTVLVAARREGTRTIYEFAFDWKAEFEPYAGPQPGTIMGCSIYLRDVDPDEKQGYLRWGEGLPWHTIRPALFNSLELLSQGPE